MRVEERTSLSGQSRVGQLCLETTTKQIVQDTVRRYNHKEAVLRRT